ncbi:hypothetical protein N7494_000501 [Penicillium frequentans]|uniref:Uncharacterized protein n=1 Tax=Penicillium frequentans TaxID=3151616 RepID=A0AAD6D698_9EURO|nr:hypothetical protein N7494_000501 [Penicillium glabrum]
MAQWWSFDANFGCAYGDEDLYHGADLDLEAAPPPLTGEEIKCLTPFEDRSPRRRALRSSDSLVPDIYTFFQENDPAAYAPASAQVNVGKSTSTPLRDSVLSQLPGAEDWADVHERYHDGV